MKQIQLMKHDVKYTEIISQLTSDPRVQTALGLNWQQVSIYGTRDFIEFIQGEERMGKQISRVIFNEDERVIGIITLKHMNRADKTAHIGTWIGANFWGMGYNELAKREMFALAFTVYGLDRVFAGATVRNERSLRAQMKLPYMTINVGENYPTHLHLIEEETNERCILNVVEREDFERYLVSGLI